MRAMQFLRKLHRLILNFHPKIYREEYGDELHAVFNLSLDEALGKGGLELMRTILREFLSLPKAIIHEHVRERRRTRMTGKFASRFDFAPGSRNETLAALAPFLLFGAFPVLFTFLQLSGFMPLWLEIAFVIFMWLSGLGLFVIGFKKGAPRWFMPYLGLPLPVINLLVFNTLNDPEWRGFPGLMQAPWLIRQIFYGGLLWGTLILLVILMILVPALIKKLHPFYQKLKDDWTLLSFIVYGTAPFMLVISFDDYANEEPYLFLSYLILAAGGWLYLRSNLPWKRFWSLFSGLTLSMFVAAIGKGILYAGPWPRPKYFTWQSEMASTLVMWGWLALIMLIPLAINLLPRPNDSSQALM